MQKEKNVGILPCKHCYFGRNLLSCLTLQSQENIFAQMRLVNFVQQYLLCRHFMKGYFTASTGARGNYTD